MNAAAARKVIVTADQAISRHNDAPMIGSAILRWNDATVLYAAGDYDLSVSAALASLRYTVGILSPVYQEASKL